MSMKDIIKSWINAMLETISGKGLANTLVLELHIPVEISEDLNVIFLSVGSTLVCIYFTLALIDKVSSDNFNTDQFVKLLLKLVLAIAIIEHAGDFVSVIQSFAESFTQVIGDNAGVNNGVEAQIGDMDLMEAILTLLLMILPFVAGLAANVVGLFMIFTYKIEFEIRKMLAPIGLADFMTGGPHSNGIRYF